MSGGSMAVPDDDPLGPVVESFLDRFRRGERPALTDLIARHPELAGRIRELIPALVELEQLGGSRGDVSPSVAQWTGSRNSGDEGPLHERLYHAAPDRRRRDGGSVRGRARVTQDPGRAQGHAPAIPGRRELFAAVPHRPVNKAWVFCWPVLGRVFTDGKGKFQMDRSTGGETMVYAFFPDKGLPPSLRSLLMPTM